MEGMLSVPGPVLRRSASQVLLLILLICHHSGYSKKFNNCCPVCSSQDFAFIGKGTERIGEVISEDFKKMGVARFLHISFRETGFNSVSGLGATRGSLPWSTVAD